MANSDRVIAALNEAWIHFGRFTDENNREVVAWVKGRLEATGSTARSIGALPILPRPMPQLTEAPSWYDRQPGEEG